MPHVLPWHQPGAFGTRLRAECHRLGYGQAALAAASGAFGEAPRYTRDDVKQWLKAKHSTRGDVLALLGALSFDLHYLLTGQRDDAHRIGLDDGLALHRTHAADLRTGDESYRWPVLVAWSAHDAVAAAELHRSTHYGACGVSERRVLDAFGEMILRRFQRLPVVLSPNVTPYLVAFWHAWCETFRMHGVAVVTIAPHDAAAHALRALMTHTAQRAA